MPVPDELQPPLHYVTVSPEPHGFSKLGQDQQTEILRTARNRVSALGVVVLCLADQTRILMVPTDITRLAVLRDAVAASVRDLIVMNVGTYSVGERAVAELPPLRHPMPARREELAGKKDDKHE